MEISEFGFYRGTGTTNRYTLVKMALNKQHSGWHGGRQKTTANANVNKKRARFRYIHLFRMGLPNPNQHSFLGDFTGEESRDRRSENHRRHYRAEQASHNAYEESS